MVRNRPLLGFFLVSVAAAVVSTSLLNPQHSLVGWLAGGTGDVAVRVFVAVAILLLGACISYAAARLAMAGLDAALMARNAAALPTLSLLTTRTAAASTVRPIDVAMRDLDAFFFIVSVK